MFILWMVALSWFPFAVGPERDLQWEFELIGPQKLITSRWLQHIIPCREPAQCRYFTALCPHSGLLYMFIYLSVMFLAPRLEQVMRVLPLTVYASPSYLKVLPTRCASLISHHFRSRPDFGHLQETTSTWVLSLMRTEINTHITPAVL